MTDTPVDLHDELQALLERATAAEAVEVKDAAAAPSFADTLTPDVVMDLAQQAASESPAVEALQAEIAQLRESLDAIASSSAPGADAEADADAADVEEDDPGMDYDEPDEAPPAGEPLSSAVEGEAGEYDPTLLPEGKAAGWENCPDCGSAGADEYADGTARCEDCGTPLQRLSTKGLDFDDDELDGVLTVLDDEAPVEAEAKALDVVELSEMELLLARREAL